MKNLKKIIKKQGFTSEILNFKFGILNCWRNKTKKLGFTLVELIIVIAIIAVLAVAAFMMLTKWLSNSRDSRRIGDVSTIKKAIEINYTTTATYPTPDYRQAILDTESNTMWYQGFFGTGASLESDNIMKAPLDPGTNEYFKYAVTLDQKEYQIGTVLEQTQVSIFNKAFASDEVAKIEGKYDGYVTYEGGGMIRIVQTPSILVYTGNSLNVNSGNSNLMLDGKNLGTPINLKKIEFNSTSTNEQIANLIETTFGVDGGEGIAEDNKTVNLNSNLTIVGSKKSCTMENGVGEQIWNGTNWSNCTVVYCYIGFTNNSTSCDWSGEARLLASDTSLSLQQTNLSTKVVNDEKVFYMDVKRDWKSLGLIPIDTSKSYRISAKIRRGNANTTGLYFGLALYDENKKVILPHQISRLGNPVTISSFDNISITTLDTISGWNSTGAGCHTRSLGLYYDGDTNHLPDYAWYYCPGGSARSTLLTEGAYGTATNNTITLNTPIPANIASNIIPGTSKIMNHTSGGTYEYTYYNSNIPDTWTTISHDLTGEERNLSGTKFRAHAKYARFLILGNRWASRTDTTKDLQFDDLRIEELP